MREILSTECITVVESCFLDDSALIRRFFRLRHYVYVEKLGWERGNSLGMEVDFYDLYSRYILVLKNREVIAGARIIEGKRGFSTFPMKVTKTLNEVSRTVIPNDAPFKINLILYYSIARSIVEMRYRYFSAMVSPKRFNAFKRHFNHVVQVGSSFEFKGNEFLIFKGDAYKIEKRLKKFFNCSFNLKNGRR